MAIIQLNVNSTHSITLGYKGEHNTDIIEVILPDSVVGGSIYLDLMLPDLTKTQTPALVDNKYPVPGDLLQTAGKGYIDVLHKKDGNVDVLCHCFLTVLDAVNASETLVPEYQDVISQWEEDEAERKEAEALRKEDELTRIENEGSREGAEGLRKQAETARENAEGVREYAEGQRELAEGAREAAYIIAEGDRDTAYGVAEGVRDGLYTTAEGSRNTAYGEAEIARDGLYTTAEGVRDGDYALAEGLRNDAYDGAEAARDGLYEAAEAARDTIVGGLDARVKVTELQNANQQVELNDIERTIALMNPTQSTRVDITSAAQTVALPKTAGIGPVKPTIKGLTATNLITGGNFPNTTGWSGVGCSISVASNTLTATVTNLGSTTSIQKASVSIISGNKYYFVMDILPKSNTVTGFIILSGTTAVTTATVTAPTANVWNTLGAVVTADGDGNNVRFLHRTNTGYALNDTIQFKNCMAINLTSIFGAGNEPDAATCALLFPTYFDGTQSAIAPRLRSANSDATETSALYTEPLTLHRVPNGTADTIEQVDGVWNYVQRVKRYVLTASDITALSTSPVSVDVVTVATLQNLYSIGATFPYTRIATDKTTPRTTAIYDDPASAWKHAYDTSRKLYFYIPKGIYADLAAAKAALAGTVIYYQLATPIYTPISSSGVLQSYPSGTIYAEHALADAGLYTTSIGVLNTDFPIESLESLYIVHPITGVKTALDHTTATIAGDGLSFTHAGLTAGDIVFFTYFYAFSGVWGANVYSHFDGSMVVADTANSKFYSWKISSTNGVASIILTEVT